MVKVGQGHSIFCIDQGPADATSAALFLHGGPGGQSQQELIDLVPRRHRVIAFDQRGCGRSRPERSIVDNTTQQTINDIEKIRQNFGIETFNIIAGSWGAALALLYAASNPERVASLLLYSPFLGSKKEVEHFFFASRKEYPTEWSTYFHTDARTTSDFDRLIEQYHERILGRPGPEQNEACQAWVEYELFAGSNGKETKLNRTLMLSGFHLTYATISCHYFQNRFFLDGCDLLTLALRVNAPTVILQGGQDLVSHPETVAQLGRNLPFADLRILPNAGHCGEGSRVDDALRAEIVRKFGT